MFEAHHVFSNIEDRKKQLSKYLLKGVPGKKQMYTFKKGEFYDVVSQRVRKVL